MGEPTSTELFLPRVARPASLSVRELWLDATEGPSAPKSFGPLVPPIRIGSARGNDVTVDDPTVSRFHATIERADDGIVVVDAGSKNGTHLGPHRVKEAWLAEGDVLRLGQTALRVRISAEVRALEISPRTSFGQLLGESHAMRVLFATLARLAHAEVPVLVEGETGTGKDLVARAIHGQGGRRDRPFVVVDCGAVSPTLVESELFGHVKGAFTGAEASRAGAFELADGGVLFLDELGELPLSLQPKLLRALETQTVKPLGADREQKVNVRVVAATHRNLRQMVNEGTFREDLYFRLAVLPLRVPPLRERPEDIVLLARHFLVRALRSASPEPLPAAWAGPELSAETIALLRASSWPGNVRELRNVVERAVIIGDLDLAMRGDLAPALRMGGTTFEPMTASGAPLGLEEAKRLFEREYLVKLLARHANDIPRAAEEANLHPKSLQRLIRRHKLRDSLG